jgi:hypothetical protein
MIVKAGKSDRDAIERQCALHDLKCEVYTMENNEEMFAYNILELDNKEPENTFIWYLARCVALELEINDLKNKPKLF